MECPTCPTLNTTTCPAPGVGAVIFTALLSKLLKSQCELMNTGTSFPPDAASHLDDCYDFIVVGAGTAGSVVSGRLSENKDWKVLVLEAGGDPPLESEVPVYSLVFSGGKTPQNWDYDAERQPEACLGLKSERCPWKNGKMIGGSGSHNAMAFLRGCRSDYNNWAALGNQGWSYDDVLPFFSMSENVTSEDIMSLKDADKYHGRDGPVKLTYQTYDSPVTRGLQEAAKKFNYRYLVDMNRESPLGFGFTQFNIANGTRCSTAKAYLGPAANNLHLVRNALVTKVQIDAGTKFVKGVRFLLNGKEVEVKVRKEVVVSAGTTNTPQILMLSGVGPSDHLQRLGIGTVVDNPHVGKNLVDHIMFYGLVVGFDKSPDNVYIKDEEEAAFQYLRGRSGPLSHSGVDSFMLFLNTNTSNNQEDPSVQVLVAVLPDAASVRQLRSIFNFKGETVEYLESLVKDYDLLVSFVGLLQPRSRGKILLNSSDPEEPPVIRAGFLRNPEDVDALVSGVEHFAALVKEAPGAKLVTPLPVSQCSHLEAMTTEFWKCALPHATFPAHHFAGTCAMGKVVDSRLRLMAVKNLRVADASVMPTIVKGSTGGPTTMIGEKAARMIKEDWSSQPV